MLLLRFIISLCVFRDASHFFLFLHTCLSCKRVLLSQAGTISPVCFVGFFVSHISAFIMPARMKAIDPIHVIKRTRTLEIKDPTTEDIYTFPRVVMVENERPRRSFMMLITYNVV